MNRTLGIILMLVAFSLAGCGNMTKGPNAAKAQVATFHQQFNDQNINAIVSSADPALFTGTPKADFTQFLAVVHRKLGNTTDSRVINQKVNTFNSITTVLLMQDTTFVKGKGTETFAFRIKNEKAYLIGYSINSRDLIMK